MTRSKTVTRAEDITRAILLLRGQKVLLDAELAALYGVTTARLNQQVRRNRKRFPADFLFEFTPPREFANLKMHFATSSWGGRRTRPPLPSTAPSRTPRHASRYRGPGKPNFQDHEL